MRMAGASAGYMYTRVEGDGERGGREREVEGGSGHSTATSNVKAESMSRCALHCIWACIIMASRVLMACDEE